MSQPDNLHCDFNPLTVEDDSNNIWGTHLVNNSAYEFTPDENQFIGPFHELYQTIEKNCSGFLLEKITNNGSDANRYAILEATYGDSAGCLFAVGSYIVGDNSCFYRYSTLNYGKHYSIGEIISPSYLKPDDWDNLFVAPYFIKGCRKGYRKMCTSCLRNLLDFEKFEDMCLRQLTCKILHNKMRRKPIKALFLELMLAGNGAVLSESYLVNLAKLCEFHQIKIVVDEILTFGRTGSCLYLSKMPKVFAKQVAYVTAGKWVGCGLVLVRSELAKKDDNDPQGSRGVSTHMPILGILDNVKKVIDNLEFTDIRRKEFLEHLQIRDYKCWGEGLIVFSPQRKLGNIDAVRCRFLLQLQETKFHNCKRVYDNNVTICAQNLHIREQLTKWINNFKNVITHFSVVPKGPARTWKPPPQVISADNKTQTTETDNTKIVVTESAKENVAKVNKIV
jgi:hypothetical protein